MLIEHGFHTNPEDSAFLQDSECLARLAVVEADVLDDFFD
jgi:N-acetylmuramoyl-L-alanine amidase